MLAASPSPRDLCCIVGASRRTIPPVVGLEVVVSSIGPEVAAVLRLQRIPSAASLQLHPCLNPVRGHRIAHRVTVIGAVVATDFGAERAAALVPDAENCALAVVSLRHVSEEMLVIASPGPGVGPEVTVGGAELTPNRANRDSGLGADNDSLVFGPFDNKWRRGLRGGG